MYSIQMYFCTNIDFRYFARIKLDRLEKRIYALEKISLT